MSLFGGALNNLHIPSIGGMKKQFNKVITDQTESFYGPKMHLFVTLTCLLYVFLDKSNSPLFAHLFIHSNICQCAITCHVGISRNKLIWPGLLFCVFHYVHSCSSRWPSEMDSCTWATSALPVQPQIIIATTYFHFFHANLAIRIMSMYFSQLSIMGIVPIDHLITWFIQGKRTILIWPRRSYHLIAVQILL